MNNLISNLKSLTVDKRNNMNSTTIIDTEIYIVLFKKRLVKLFDVYTVGFIIPIRRYIGGMVIVWIF